MLYFGFASFCLLGYLGIAGATQAYYTDITASEDNALNGDPMQQVPITHKLFHQCSMKERCNYVIREIATGFHALYNGKDELPQKKTGLRIWKKVFADQMTDCRDVYESGRRTNGLFTINIPVLGDSKVRCDLTTEPGGWIVFQRRVDATVGFNRTWIEYKEGFGDLNGNFWLGLEKLHHLAPPGRGARLRVDLKYIDNSNLLKYAEYSLFEISNEADGYRINIGSYSGTAGDSMIYSNGAKFTTKDVDNDLNNAVNAAIYLGPWWHRVSSRAGLNHLFPLSGNTSNGAAMYWINPTQDYEEVVFAEMKVIF